MSAYLLVPLVTTLSPLMEISQRMVRVSLGRRFSWGCRSSVCDTNLANPRLSLGRFFSKIYSHLNFKIFQDDTFCSHEKTDLLALVLVPSLSTILNMMSALMGTSQTPSL